MDEQAPAPVQPPETQQHPKLTQEALWQFSLRYYSIREVKETCLLLQNQFHGNVNLVLALKWLDEHQLSFPASAWPQLIQTLARTDALLSHFRKLRRKSKPHLPDVLYKEALQYELRLERQQQADIVEGIASLCLKLTPHTHLIDDYCHQIGAEHLCTVFNHHGL